MSQRNPPSPPLNLGRYMSADSANAVIRNAANVGDLYANAPLPRLEISDRSGYYSYQEHFNDARESLKQRHIEKSWQELHEAEEGSEREVQAVVALSDIIFGDNEIAGYIDALNGDIAKMAAATEMPPAVYLGSLMTEAKFYGVVTDIDTPTVQATMEFTNATEIVPGEQGPGWSALGLLGPEAIQ